MGLSTSIYVGYYIVAKMKKIMITEKDVQCEKHSKHHVRGNENFCSKCGAKVVEVTKEVPSHQSLYEVFCGESDFGDNLSPEDYQFLKDNFGVVPGEWVGWDNECGEELVLCSNFNAHIDADGEGVHELPDPFQLVMPSIGRLKDIMQYKTCELKYGVLVSVA